MQQSKLISAAKYAKLRGLNRSTISRQIRSGAIPTHDGKIDPKEADAARARNLDQAKRAGAEIRKRRPGAKSEKPIAATSVSSAVPVEVDGINEARTEALLQIVSPERVLRFAGALAELGLDPETACAAGQLFSLMASDALTDIDCEDRRFVDPTPEQWEMVLGQFDLNTADGMADSAMARQ